MGKLLALLMLLPCLASAGTVVATRTLPAGTVIEARDIAMQADAEGIEAELSDFVGQQLRVMVYQGRRIDPAHLTAPTLVGRNQIVTIAYERSALRIEAEGRALSAGSLGQVIRVMNNTSRITVSGRVAADGTVVIEQN